MMVKMPTAPTSSEMLPSAATAKVSTPSTEPSVSSICCCVVMVKSSSPWRATSTRRMPSTTSSHRRVLLVQHVDLEQAFAVEQLERARRRDVDGVVEVEADHRALRPHHADDAVALAADAQRLRRARSHRRTAAAPSSSRARRSCAARADRPAAGSCPCATSKRNASANSGPDAVHGRRAACGRCASTSALPCTIGSEAMTYGARCSASASSMVSGRTVPNAPIEPPMVCGRARRDADEVGAELRELGDHELPHALADRGEQHHGRDADGDAERGEQRRACGAHSTEPPVNRTRSAARTAQRLPASATTGSSRAARRAGSRPNTTPLATAITTASATAQAGAPTGSAG